jgi:hypothetical protein
MIAVVTAACNRGPSDEQAQAAIRAARPALDSSTMVERVWQDGPAWFSCAEVLAKLRLPSDSSAIRDPLANWRGLLLSAWGVVRDSTHGPVTDPGWCVVKLLPDSVTPARGWASFTGPPFPTGSRRRGWLVTVGRSRIELRESARAITRDAAEVEYVVGLARNANGVALRSAHDTASFRAKLRRQGGRWSMTHDRPVSGTAR